MGYAIFFISGVAFTVGIIILLLRFRRTGEFLKNAAERISKYKSKAKNDALNDAFMNIINY